MVSSALLQAGWEAAHGAPPAWYGALAVWGPVAAALLLLVLLARAILHRPRYRALAVLGEAERERVHAALREAERRTAGEIVPIVLERSDRHPGADWLAAMTFLLVGSALLAPHLSWDSPPLVLLAQLGLGAAGFLAARALPGFKRLFVSETRATEMAEEQAQQEFFANALHRTEGSSGILLFVSLLERRSIVLADEGIASRVAPETWAEADRSVLEGIRRGSLCDGLVAAIAACGAVLAEHAPWREGDRNELPDRLIVRRE
jgi:putative membrane protein